MKKSGMVSVGSRGGVVIYGMAITFVALVGLGGASGSEPDLRSRMAGAWRNLREVPQIDVDQDAKADSAGTSEGPTFRGVDMAAVATRVAELDQVLYFVGDLCVMDSQGHQMISNVVYEGEVARRVDAYTGMALPGELTVVDGMLVDRIPGAGFKVRYRRLVEIPESVRLDAYEVGSRQPDESERVAIQKEIAGRMKREQDVRFKAMGAEKSSPNGIDEAALEAMEAVDRENTVRLIELLKDVGWLSSERFGKETQLGAFLILQHSGNIRLMRTILPLIEREAKSDPKLGQLYALLYDRLQISLGRKQRFGSQAIPNADGSQTIGRLEDRARVDQWRKEMGMGPLEEYAEHLGRMTGAKVSIGD